MFVTLLPTILFAWTAVCATQTSRRLGAKRANLLRLVLAMMLLGGWYIFRGLPIPFQPQMLFVLAGFIGFGIGGWIMFIALQRIGSTLSLLIVECASAIWTAGIGWVILGAKLDLIQITFASFSICGVLVALLPEIKRNQWQQPIFKGGILLATVASLGQAISFSISKYAFNLMEKTPGFSIPISAAFFRVVGGFSAAFMIWVFFRRISDTTQLKGRYPEKKSQYNIIWWITMNTLAGPVFGVTAMLWAIREVGNPGLVQSVVACATLISVPLSHKFESHRFNRRYYLGAIISILGTSGLILF